MHSHFYLESGSMVVQWLAQGRNRKMHLGHLGSLCVEFALPAVKLIGDSLP